MSAAATFDAYANSDSSNIRGCAEGAVKNRASKPNVRLASGKVIARADIYHGMELDAEERLSTVPATEDVAEDAFELVEDHGVVANKEWDGTQEKLSGDQKEKILVLYDEYRPRLLRYMRSMHLKHDSAEEVIQETFMRLTMELLKGIEIENVRGWIVRVAHNIAIDLLKKQRAPIITDESVAFLIENRADSALSPEEAYSQKEQSVKMNVALAALRPLHRQCFQMRAQGFRYQDIGLVFGISEQRVAFIVKQVAVRLAAACE